jgi:hypothetical protein
MTAPLITFTEAEAIGQRLHDRWHSMTGKPPLERDDMAWGDIVQFVMRCAGEAIVEREEGL